MNKTEIDWLKHFDDDIVYVQTDEKLGSRAYLLLDPDIPGSLHPQFTEKHTEYTYKVFLDKLPTTPEGAQLYLFQSFTELSQSLYNDGQALTHEYWRYDFNFDGGNPLVMAKIDALALVTKAMRPSTVIASTAYLGIASDSPYKVYDNPWMGQFYRLIFSWYAALLKDIELPDGMKFWK